MAAFVKYTCEGPWWTSSFVPDQARRDQRSAGTQKSSVRVGFAGSWPCQLHSHPWQLGLLPACLSSTAWRKSGASGLSVAGERCRHKVGIWNTVWALPCFSLLPKSFESEITKILNWPCRDLFAVFIFRMHFKAANSFFGLVANGNPERSSSILPKCASMLLHIKVLF